MHDDEISNEAGSAETVPPPPEAGAVDHLLTVAKAAAGVVPFAGSALEQALDAVFGPPLERHRQAWLTRLADLVNELAATGARSADELAADDVFVSAVTRASRAAIGTHLEAKLDMFKAVLQHHALDPSRGDVVTLRYIQWVDELEPDHAVILSYAADPRGWYERHGITPASVYAGARQGALDGAQIPVDAAVFDMAMYDLSARRLADIGMLSGMVTGGAYLDPWITTTGADWLHWVTTV